MNSPSTPVVSRSPTPAPARALAANPRPALGVPATEQSDSIEQSIERYRGFSRESGQRHAANMRGTSPSSRRPAIDASTYAQPSTTNLPSFAAARKAARMSPPQVDSAEITPEFARADSAAAYLETAPLLLEGGSPSAFSNLSQSTLRPPLPADNRALLELGQLQPEQVPFSVRLARARQKILTGLRDPAADGPSAACWLGISTLCLVSTTVLWTSWWMNGWREATVLGACLGAVGTFGFISAESALTRTSRALGDEVRPWMTGRHVAMQLYWMVGSCALVAGYINDGVAMRRAGVAVLGAALYETDQTISRAAVLANIMPDLPPANPDLVPPPGNPLALAFLEFGSYLWGEGQELGDLNLAVYGMYVGLAGAAMAIEKGRVMSLLFTSIGWANIGQATVDGRWQHWAMGLGAAAVGFSLNLQANVHVLSAPQAGRRLAAGSTAAYASIGQAPAPASLA